MQTKFFKYELGNLSSKVKSHMKFQRIRDIITAIEGKTPQRQMAW